jgi:hypothetical protein
MKTFSETARYLRFSAPMLSHLSQFACSNTLLTDSISTLRQSDTTTSDRTVIIVVLAPSSSASAATLRVPVFVCAYCVCVFLPWYGGCLNENTVLLQSCPIDSTLVNLRYCSSNQNVQHSFLVHGARRWHQSQGRPRRLSDMRGCHGFGHIIQLFITAVFLGCAFEMYIY